MCLIHGVPTKYLKSNTYGAPCIFTHRDLSSTGRTVPTVSADYATSLLMSFSFIFGLVLILDVVFRDINPANLDEIFRSKRDTDRVVYARDMLDGAENRYRETDQSY